MIPRNRVDIDTAILDAVESIDCPISLKTARNKRRRQRCMVAKNIIGVALRIAIIISKTKTNL